MFNIAGSNLRYPFHVAFAGLHGLGVILGLAYKSKTPDLYPGNSHKKLGWVLTVLVFAHFIVGVLRSFTKRREPNIVYELRPFIPRKLLRAEAQTLVTPTEVHRPGTYLRPPYDRNVQQRKPTLRRYLTSIYTIIQGWNTDSTNQCHGVDGG